MNNGTATAVVELAALAAGGGVTWLSARLLARRDRSTARELASLPSPARVAAARAEAEVTGWQQLLVQGRLQPVTAPVADPGNPGRWLTLAEDPTGALGEVRVLVGVDGSPQADGQHGVHGVVVPSHLTHPIAAAAWTYDDPTHPLRTTAAAYADMAVRR